MAGDFAEFAGVCEQVHSTKSKNAKVFVISEYLPKLDEASLPIAVLFLSGNVFAKGSGLALNVGFNTIMRSLEDIAKLEPEDIQRIYLEHGDLGALAEHAVLKKQVLPLVQQRLTLPEIHGQLKKMAEASGRGAGEAKKKILAGMLINCSPLEAKYLIKIAEGEMRTGVVEGLVQLALAKAFGKDVEQVHQAMLVSGDVAQVAMLAKKGELGTATMKPLTPLSFMLADVMSNAEEIAEYYKKPLICEYKYDGIRAQMHKLGGEVKIFSRKLENVTESFPELLAAARSMPDDFILDGEIIAYRDGMPLHFQELQKRLRRKAMVEQLVREVPLIYTPYDVLYLNGRQVIDLPMAERKKILAGIKFKEPIVDLGYRIVTSAQEIAEAFAESRKIGHEGLVLKDPEAQYLPGKRGRHWAKLKQELDTIDAVIVATEYGHGKRAGLLSDYTFAVKDGAQLKVIGKAYSGLTDHEIDEMTAKLKSIATRDEGYRLAVKPEIVLEVAFDRIQKSGRHVSGFALRFPRIKRIRTDKLADDIDTLEKIREIYQRQKHQAGEQR